MAKHQPFLIIVNHWEIQSSQVGQHVVDLVVLVLISRFLGRRLCRTFGKFTSQIRGRDVDVGRTNRPNSLDHWMRLFAFSIAGRSKGSTRSWDDQNRPVIEVDNVLGSSPTIYCESWGICCFFMLLDSGFLHINIRHGHGNKLGC